jgi:hypothetical protein
MSLDFHRAQLLEWLLMHDCFDSPRAYGHTMAMTKRWWGAYKAWEAGDSFLTAFTEERLAVTQRPWKMKSVPGKDVNLNATPQANQQGPKMTHGTNLQYRTDVASFKQRLDPANFKRSPVEGNPTQVRRMKYELGLHDMSASLLDPTKATISEQLRWKFKGQGKGLEWAVVLMPLPKVEDLAVLALLRYAAKPLKDKVPTFYRAVSFMKNRMSRVKFAQESDMGATFLEQGSAQDPHLRYGATDFQVEKNNAGIEVSRYVAGISQLRRAKAREYNTILARQRERGGASNEIVVAFRQHASPRFPIIGIPCDDGTWYQVQDEQSACYRNAAILDVWRSTVQT